MICPCDGKPMRPKECAACLYQCLTQVFGLGDKFTVIPDGAGIKVIRLETVRNA